MKEMYNIFTIHEERRGQPPQPRRTIAVTRATEEPKDAFSLEELREQAVERFAKATAEKDAFPYGHLMREIIPVDPASVHALARAFKLPDGAVMYEKVAPPEEQIDQGADAHSTRA